MADTDTDSEWEFALIEPLLPPWRDPALARAELERFIADMRPEDALGLRLVREMVVQSAWADFVCGAFKPTLDHLVGGRPVTQAVLGEAFATHFTLLDGMIASAASVRNGRDRLARFYDSRECTRLRAALGLLEAELNALQPPPANPGEPEMAEGEDG